MRWSYGIATVDERLETLLPPTIASLARAGFHKPTLFVDGCEDPSKYDHFQLPVAARRYKVKTNGHWMLSIQELYYRNPWCDRYAMFQDDILCCQNLREYLEQWYPDKGYLNLCTYPENADRIDGGSGWHPAPRNGKGAQALVFDQHSLKALMSATYFFDWAKNRRTGFKNNDGAVYCSLKPQGYIEHVHMPSLVDHTGAEGKGVMGTRHQPVITAFPGEEYDPLNKDQEGEHV